MATIEVVEDNVIVLEVGEQGPIGPTGPTGPGVPDGGTTGQVLAKASDTDQDTTWVDDTGALWGGITGTLSNQTDLQNALNQKSNTSHNHDGVYAPVVHNHDGDYLKNLVEDASPQIGANLDLQGNDLQNVGDIYGEANFHLRLLAAVGYRISLESEVTMINNKIINLGAPSNDSDAATKKYVDDKFALGGSAVMTVSATAPSTPSLGDFWLDTTGTPDQLMVYTDAGWESALYKSEADDPNNDIGFNDGYF